MNRIKLTLIVVASAIVLAGCSLNRMTANRTADMMSEASVAFNEEGDLEFAHDAMPANLKMMEGMQRVSPKNETLLFMLAQGFCSYSFAFLEESERKGDLERARAFYRRGYEYGLAALPEAVRKYAKGNLEEFGNAVAKTDKGALPQLFWTAYCLAGYVNVNKVDVGAVADLPRAELMMKRVLELDESYYHGGAHLFYAGFYGARPKMLGGSPQKAREHVERAIALTQGRFLLADYFRAFFVGVPTQDEAIFDSSLKHVLDASSDVMPSERLANQIAKKRAERLKAKKKELF